MSESQPWCQNHMMSLSTCPCTRGKRKEAHAWWCNATKPGLPQACNCEETHAPPTPLGTALSGTASDLKTPEYSGGSVDYYKVPITSPTTPYTIPYTAECNDIIEALGMNYAEGNAFKAIWRKAAQRTLGKAKAGAKADGLYDSEKVEFFGKRLVIQSKAVRDAKA